MANKLSGVVLSIHIKGPPPTHFIKVEDVLVHGEGTFTEALQGGQSTIELTLTKGKVEPDQKLTVNESVFVGGVRSDGTKFTFPGELQITHAVKPWKLSGKFGSTG